MTEVETVEVVEYEPEMAVAIREEREQAQPPANVLPSPAEWEATLAVARAIAATQFVPEAYRGQPEAVVAAILTGRELGIGPMQALREIHMIDGRAAFSASLMLSQMRRGGLVIVDSESTAERAFIRARRSDTGEEATVEWTMAEADKILRGSKPLTASAGWKNYPSDMLWARCVGRLARRLGGDLLGGMHYAAEEVRDFDGEGGYGGSGYDTAAREVDPAKELLPGAIDVKDAATAEAVRDAVGRITRRTDTAAETEAGEHVEGAPQDEWKAAAWGRHWKRLANFVVRAQDIAGGDFPPPTNEQVAEAWAWAFNGHDITDALRGPETDGEARVEPEGGEPAADAQEGNQRRTEGSASPGAVDDDAA